MNTSNKVTDLVDSLARALSDAVENVVYLDRVDSTHALSLRLIDQIDQQGAELAPTVIIGGQQTMGRGRGDRHWVSPAGGLYLSWARSGIDSGIVNRLPILAAAAAHGAIENAGVTRAGIKWPNDIVVDGRKLAGLLIHVRAAEKGWATVGLGVNLETAPELDQPMAAAATALSALVEPLPYERWCVDISTSFIASFTRFLADPDPAIDVWRHHLIHRPGERLTVRLGGGKTVDGEYQGLTDEGFLRLAINDVEHVITSGDVFKSG